MLLFEGLVWNKFVFVCVEWVGNGWGKIKVEVVLIVEVLVLFFFFDDLCVGGMFFEVIVNGSF